MRLLADEDDTMIGTTLLALLRAGHFAVDQVRDGEMAEAGLGEHVGDYAALAS